ncbi:zinc-binding dehydrogenase [Amycolatopsis sp. H20-H5]|uniref:zinc-binding dehydrogenase n=1 Tax=Amycolatopsis sp. H20-H5 TaxID=3046309 RepID=UPI002DB6B941|nr:zinc-binding dehydrogenase [Amycolatopsis sp. H20-H5]MEC3977525.1 zinc-binding dehydrogenase [Amycolatopsis sp. H20-H5]
MVNTPGGVAPTGIREVGEPEPGADEAVVAVRSFSVNRGELSLIERRPDGWRPGQDIAGVVVREAATGAGPRLGDRVTGLADQAGWAERAALPVSRIAVLPDNVGFGDACTLGIAGLTAVRLIRRIGALIGKRVLVTGAAGGVGRLLVELAYGAGAHVSAVVSSEKRGEGLDALGAQRVVTDVNELTGPFEVVFEAAGGEQLAASIRMVAAYGTVLLYGNSSREPIPFDFNTLMRGHVGARVDSLLYATGDPDDVDLAILVELVATGRLHPKIGYGGSWRGLNDALDALRGREVAGKVVLDIG